MSDKETPQHDQLRKRSKTAHIRQLLAKYSDEDSFGSAPGSNSDWSLDNDSTSTNLSNSQEEDDALEWLIFGNREEVMTPIADMT